VYRGAARPDNGDRVGPVYSLGVRPIA